MKQISHDIHHYKAALWLESILPVSSIERLRISALAATGSGTTLYLLAQYLSLPISDTAILGGTCIAAGLYIEQTLLYLYHTSYSNRGLASRIGTNHYGHVGCTYEVAAILSTHEHDMTRAVFTSLLGEDIATRAAINIPSLQEFLATDRIKLTTDLLTPKAHAPLTLYDVIVTLGEHDIALQNWLQNAGISTATLYGSARLCTNALHSKKQATRFWSRDALSQHQNLAGRFGAKHASTRIPYTISPTKLEGIVLPEVSTHLEAITRILCGKRGSNCVLVGDEGIGATELVATLAEQLAHGTALGSLLGDSLVVVDVDRILATNTNKDSIEVALESIAATAATMPGTILCLFDIATTLERLAHHGVDIDDTILSWLARTDLRIITTTSSYDMNKLRRTYPIILDRSESVVLSEQNVPALLDILQANIITHEQQTRTRYTYQALEVIADAAIQAPTPSYETALRLLTLVTHHHEHRSTLITKVDAAHILTHDLATVTEPYVPDTNNDLHQLSAILRAHCPAEEQAIKKIVQTLALANLKSTTSGRPHGRFIFVGAKGTGKNETALAVAACYKGSAEAITMLQADELATTTNIKEHTTALVIHLEPGASSDTIARCAHLLTDSYYTTRDNSRIDLTNCLIIITTTAGEELIKKTAPSRQQNPTLTSELLHSLTALGYLPNELVHHVDAICIFETPSETYREAYIEQAIVHQRILLNSKGYSLQVTKDARDMMRQDSEEGMYHHVSKLLQTGIRKHIIRGDAGRGDTITVTAHDLQ
jgi:hypothetical protein